MQAATSFTKQPQGGNRKKTGTEKHKTGALIDWDDRGPAHNQVGVWCANVDKCVTPGVKAYVNQSNFAYKNWSGRCPACIDRDGLPLRLTGRGDLPSGAYFDFDDRDPADRVRAKLYCPRGIHPRFYLAEKYGEMLKKEQSGLCRSCGRIRIKRPTEDEKIESTKSTIYWTKSSKGNKGTVPVGCGYCGEIRNVRVRSILDRRLDDRGFTGLCQKHRNEDIRSFILKQLASHQSHGAVILNGDSSQPKGKTGPKPKSADKFLGDVRAVIVELYNKRQSDRGVTLSAAAPQLHLRNHNLSEDGIRKKLKRKTNLTWEGFVESVLKDCGHISN